MYIYISCSLNGKALKRIQNELALLLLLFFGKALQWRLSFTSRGNDDVTLWGEENNILFKPVVRRNLRTPRVLLDDRSKKKTKYKCICVYIYLYIVEIQIIVFGMVFGQSSFWWIFF